MEALRESFLNLTFQMSLYKRATLDEEDLVDSTGDDIYPSSPMQVNVRPTRRGHGASLGPPPWRT